MTLTTLALFIALPLLVAGAARKPRQHHAMKASNAWIKRWARTDESIWPAVSAASRIFGTSESLMRTIVGREGGNVNPRTLRSSLCGHGQTGWNNAGSAAFGAFQFMLAYKGACFRRSAWGTFGSYDDAAFAEAKRLGVPVPFRFKHPASNVGQAVTAAYMLAHGGLSHWCASMCRA